MQQENIHGLAMCMENVFAHKPMTDGQCYNSGYHISWVYSYLVHKIATMMAMLEYGSSEKNGHEC